jgi:hypothetical protein
MNNSSVRNTVVLGTCVVVIQLLLGQWDVSATFNRIARVSGTCVVVVAADLLVPA